MKNLGIFSLLILLVFSSCRKDTNIDETTPWSPKPAVENYTPPVQDIVGNLTGFIIDESGTPLGNATVTMNDEMTTTDDYGHFFFKNETMNSLGALVQIKKEGYFDGSRRFFPKAGENNRVKIQMLTKSFDDSFNTVDGATVQMNDGASVTFAANSIRTEAGQAYEGIVKVATKWMDPSLIETLNQMPGNLQGVNSSVEAVALATYGMIAVELEGANGQKLNIAEGQTAEISMPVPATLQADAPATIPLWSYNEEFGMWVEESVATLQNGAYVGEVSHFSFWNCDLPIEYVNLNITLTDANGEPLDNYVVSLTVGTSGAFSSGYGVTDENGNVSGAIPANEALELNVLGYCGEVLYTENIGPFATDADLAITADASNINSTTISGTLVDCDGVPVDEGYVKVTFDGITTYFYTTTAAFSQTFTTCGTPGDMSIAGINLATLEISAVEVTAPSNATTDLGNLSACGDVITTGLTITVDGVSKFYPLVNVSSAPNGTLFDVEFPAGTNNGIYFGFVGTDVGNYDGVENMVELIGDADMGWQLWSNSQGGFTSFVVTQYDTHVVGSASGELVDFTTGVISSVQLSFDVEL